MVNSGRREPEQDAHLLLVLLDHLLPEAVCGCHGNYTRLSHGCFHPHINCNTQGMVTLSDGGVFTLGGSWSGGYSGVNGNPDKNGEVRPLRSTDMP